VVVAEIVMMPVHLPMVVLAGRSGSGVRRDGILAGAGVFLLKYRQYRRVRNIARFPTADYHALDTGHFALEDKSDEIAALIRNFLPRALQPA
jgi:hypothetical protein